MLSSWQRGACSHGLLYLGGLTYPPSQDLSGEQRRWLFSEGGAVGQMLVRIRPGSFWQVGREERQEKGVQVTEGSHPFAGRGREGKV